MKTVMTACNKWNNTEPYQNDIQPCGAGVAQRLCNGLPRDDPGFDSQWERCKNRASRPSQGTVNVGAVSE